MFVLMQTLMLIHSRRAHEVNYVCEPMWSALLMR